MAIKTLIAIISDVHANLEALVAVLADIRRRGVATIYCLGDTVGYGASPVECLNLVRQNCTKILLGNHDNAVVDPKNANEFNPAAALAAYWTREILSRDTSNNHLEFLKTLQSREDESGVCYCHGSPRTPLDEYMSPDVAENCDFMREIFSEFDEVAFCGHTHTPGFFAESTFFLDDFDFFEQAKCPSAVSLQDFGKVVVNVGSVGQPRDCNPDACYVIFNGQQFEFHRVSYDIEESIRKILAQPDLSPRLGERLREGR